MHQMRVTNDRKIPVEGDPNSVLRQVDGNGKVIQERHYGPDGRATKDIHGLAPGQAHEHVWDWSNPRVPDRIFTRPLPGR